MSSFTAAGGGGSMQSSSSACSFRIVAINDVYELDNLPRYKVAKDTKKLECVKATSQGKADLTIGVIAGDFLMPSLLSSIDKGCGMTDSLNRCGIDFCCIGNHEGDLEYKQFVHRVNESNFTWINSNIPEMPDLKLPEYVILEIESEDKTHKRRIALLGLCCEDMSVFSPNPFKSVPILPVNATAKEVYARIINTENVDCVIPITHQLIPLDRELAGCGLFPLIIGGHEHEVYLENLQNGFASDGTCTIIKTGSEAAHFATCDITWDTAASPKNPKVEVTLEDTKAYAADSDLEAVIKGHKAILDELVGTMLFKIDPADDLSSVDIRLKQTTMGTVICDCVKAELNVEICCIVSGSIRAQRHYKDVSTFTYGHLKSEVPFNSSVMVMDLPGNVLCDCIEYSRSFALLTPPQTKGCFFQCDSCVVWDRVSNKVMHINGRPVDRTKVYRCAIESGILDGMDNIIPLLSYVASLPADHRLRVHDSDCDINVKHIIVSRFSKNLLLNILKEAGGFSNIDTDGNQELSKDELIQYLIRSGREAEISAILINNIFNVADVNQSGHISKSELLQLELTNFPLQRRVTDSEACTTTTIQAAASRLGTEFDDDRLHRDVARNIDTDASGKITVGEYDEFITSLNKKRKVDI